MIVIRYVISGLNSFSGDNFLAGSSDGWGVGGPKMAAGVSHVQKLAKGMSAECVSAVFHHSGGIVALYCLDSPLLPPKFVLGVHKHTQLFL